MPLGDAPFHLIFNLDNGLCPERESSKRYLSDVKNIFTTHKIDMYHACKTARVFDYFDEYATMLEEISCISKLKGRYEGHAKDPISSGLAFESFVPKDYFADEQKEVFIMGAGGSSVSICFYLLQRINEVANVFD